MRCFPSVLSGGDVVSVACGGRGRPSSVDGGSAWGATSGVCPASLCTVLPFALSHSESSLSEERPRLLRMETRRSRSSPSVNVSCSCFGSKLVVLLAPGYEGSTAPSPRVMPCNPLSSDTESAGCDRETGAIVEIPSMVLGKEGTLSTPDGREDPEEMTEFDRAGIEMGVFVPKKNGFSLSFPAGSCAPPLVSTLEGSPVPLDGGRDREEERCPAVSLSPVEDPTVAEGPRDVPLGRRFMVRLSKRVLFPSGSDVFLSVSVLSSLVGREYEEEEYPGTVRDTRRGPRGEDTRGLPMAVVSVLGSGGGGNDDARSRSLPRLFPLPSGCGVTGVLAVATNAGE